jgi:hypothetical protein
MRSDTTRVVALFVVGGLYWQFVCRTAGVSEPWDGDGYWRLWYPLSCALAAAGGYLLRKRGWRAGALVTFAQLPVMLLNGGAGPLLAVGVLFLGVLAIPVVAIATAAGRLATRARSR